MPKEFFFQIYAKENWEILYWGEKIERAKVQIENSISSRKIKKMRMKVKSVKNKKKMKENWKRKNKWKRKVHLGHWKRKEWWREKVSFDFCVKWIYAKKVWKKKIEREGSEIEREGKKVKVRKSEKVKNFWTIFEEKKRDLLIFWNF